MFSIFDDDGSGEIDFHECVLSLWNYCSLNESSLVTFAFDMYDRDGSGVIDQEEVRKILMDVYGEHFLTNPYAKSYVSVFLSSSAN